MQNQSEKSNEVCVKRIVLDVLKPHMPNALKFSRAIAQIGRDYRVNLTVIEVDEHTETLQVVVEGSAVDFEAVQAGINDMGGSVHSVDEVEVHSGVGAG